MMNTANRFPPSQPVANPQRDLIASLWRGICRRCPNCDRGKLFSRYLKVEDHCRRCGEDLYHQRADDAPPYFTIFIVGHIIVPLVLVVERAYQPSYIVHAGLWFPLVLLLTLTLLPIVKGGLVALQWALYMHGFASSETRHQTDSVRTSYK